MYGNRVTVVNSHAVGNIAAVYCRTNERVDILGLSYHIARSLLPVTSLLQTPNLYPIPTIEAHVPLLMPACDPTHTSTSCPCKVRGLYSMHAL